MSTSARKVARPSTVNDLVSRYRHQAINKPAAGESQLELEVRFGSLDYPLIESIVTKMLAGVERGEFIVNQSHTLNTMRQPPSKGIRTNQFHDVGQQIWQKEFIPDGTRKSTYYQKKALEAPVIIRTSSSSALNYRVVLSAETPIAQFSTSVKDVIFRAKNRLSFEAAGNQPHPLKGWRLDITIVTTLSNSQKSSLPEMISTLFSLKDKRSNQTPQTVFKMLGLSDERLPKMARLAQQQGYKYEMELEYVGDSPTLSAEGVLGAVSAVMHMANPGYLADAKMQNTLRNVAEYVTDSSALLQSFASGARGLKQLTPQAVSLTRGEYGEMYPPKGFLTDKADGIHALAVVQKDHLTIIAPGLGTSFTKSLAQIKDQGASLKDQKMVEFSFDETVGDGPIKTYQVERPAKTGDLTSLTVIDGELVPVEPKKAARDDFPFKFWAFDVIVAQGTNVASRPFEERILELQLTTSTVGVFTDAAVKPFVQLTDTDPKVLKAQFDEMYHRKNREYENDGLVLYGLGQPYSKTSIHKWKPLRQNTIDFLARRPPDSVLGTFPFVDRPGHKLYFLFVGIAQEQFSRFNLTFCPGYDEMFPPHSRSNGYFPVQFPPSDQPYAYLYQHPDTDKREIDGHIIELNIDTSEGADGTVFKAPKDQGVSHYIDPAPQWNLIRIRDDREEDLQKGRLFGNNILPAEMNWTNLRDPLTYEMLYQGPGGSYFSVAKSGIYTAQTNYISSAKTDIMSSYVGGRDMVVDLGSGKGQDIGRYLQHHVKAVVMVDADPSALAELVRRKYIWNTRNLGVGQTKTRILVKKASFTDPHQNVSRAIRSFPEYPPKGADGVVCNLAAHYAFATKESMTNFVMLCRALVKPEGLVILLLMDGGQILEKFKKYKIAPGGSWDLVENDTLKFSVRRLFSEDELTPAGQKIGVLLPFSRGVLYEEYVSNFDELTRVFGLKGFDLIENKSLWGNYGNRGAQKVKRTFTENDVEWLKLFSVLVFRRRIG